MMSVRFGFGSLVVSRPTNTPFNYKHSLETVVCLQFEGSAFIVDLTTQDVDDLIAVLQHLKARPG